VVYVLLQQSMQTVSKQLTNFLMLFGSTWAEICGTFFQEQSQTVYSGGPYVTLFLRCFLAQISRHATQMIIIDYAATDKRLPLQNCP